MKLIKRLKHIFYALPFGMKGAEEEMMFSKVSSQSDVPGTHQIIQSNNLGKDLIKGEVTQEVKNLRYSDYQVSRESNKYKYIGNGEAVKKNNKRNESNKIHFIQFNKSICSSVIDGMNDANVINLNKKTLSISYSDTPKFFIENFCTHFEFISNNINSSILKLYFNDIHDKSEPITISFINELKSLMNKMLDSSLKDYQLKHHFMLSSINSIYFVTDKTDNEDDLVSYSLSNVHGTNVEHVNNEYIIYYEIGDFKRIDLLDKFYSKEQQEKYDKKESKEQNVIIRNYNQVYKCSKCGCEINKYDASITKETYGEPLCIKCLEQKILENNV